MAIDSVDATLFVVDGSVEAGRGDQFVAELLAHTSGPVILGMNKIDQQPEEPEAVAALDASYQSLADAQGWPLVKFSALHETSLDTLLATLIDQLDPGPYYYPPDLVTDQPERFIMGELIREQILLNTREEVPHSVAIAVDRVEEDTNITRILATIHVERESQKGILIGKKGSMLKVIGSDARQQIQKLVMGQVYLELFGKVVPKWRQSRSRLEDFGYRVEE
jgi:GTP-binding protein Era